MLSGSIYFGYMDMDVFFLLPPIIETPRIKSWNSFCSYRIQIQSWLFAYNKTVQSKYWKLFKESGWGKYRIPSTTKSVDFIMEGILVKDSDFSDLDVLTKQIEKGTLSFIEDVERYLTNHRELGQEMEEEIKTLLNTGNEALLALLNGTCLKKKWASKNYGPCQE